MWLDQISAEAKPPKLTRYRGPWKLKKKNDHPGWTWFHGWTRSNDLITISKDHENWYREKACIWPWKFAHWPWNFVKNVKMKIWIFPRFSPDIMGCKTWKPFFFTFSRFSRNSWPSCVIWWLRHEISRNPRENYQFVTSKDICPVENVCSQQCRVYIWLD